MALNATKLAQRNSASDLLKAFLIKEVEFRIGNKFVDIPDTNLKLDRLINDLAEDLSENSDVLFNYDKIDSYLQSQIFEITGGI